MFKQVKYGLITAWSLGAGCMSGLDAAELKSFVNLNTGYRNDNARVGLCATLSDPNYYGYGLAKFQSVNMWEVQLAGFGAITDSFYIRAMADYATVLGGKYHDSGVFDILSDPFNATLGQTYYSCCCCVDDCPPCNCDCGDQTYRATVATQGALKGHAWDVSGALGYMFHISEEFGIAPVIGWSFNEQRYKTTSGSFGPMPTQYMLAPCSDDKWADNLFMMSGTAPRVGFGLGELDDNCTSLVRVIVGQNACSEFSVGCGAPCVAFGLCSNDTVYRARWNGPFIGLDFLWTPTQDWYLNFGYELHYQMMRGRFSTLGAGDCCNDNCGCDYCPGFLDMRASYENSGADATFLPGSCVPFCPSCISWSKNGWGQVFFAGLNYLCSENWQVGVLLNYTMANVSGCASVDPCESCCTVFNGAARDPVRTLEALGEVGTNPTWANGTFQKARWRSFGAQVLLGYVF